MPTGEGAAVSDECDAATSDSSCLAESAALTWAGRDGFLPTLPAAGWYARYDFTGEPPVSTMLTSVSNPAHACEPISRLPTGNGRAVIIEEGNCSLSTKARHAMEAGAAALIFVSKDQSTSAAMDCKTTSEQWPPGVRHTSLRLWIK